MTMPHYVKPTSLTKLEVHNILHCRQKTTVNLTCTENFGKFGYVILQICNWLI